MVEKINENCKEIKISIISKETNNWKNSLSLTDGDTLVVFFDRDKYDVNEIQQMANLLTRWFPRNKICTLFDDITLGVIKND